MIKNQPKVNTYKEYVKAFNEQNTKLPARLKKELRTRKEWQYAMNSGLNNKELFNVDFYEYSDKQAAAMQKAAGKTGQKLTKEKIKLGYFDWGKIEDKRMELRSQGMTGGQIAIIIGQQFFGSN